MKICEQLLSPYEAPEYTPLTPSPLPLDLRSQCIGITAIGYGFGCLRPSGICISRPACDAVKKCLHPGDLGPRPTYTDSQASTEN